MTPLSTATLDIVPGKSVGPFCLGDSLWKTLEYLRTHKVEFPKINIGWNVEIAATSAIVIQVIPHIILTFPATTPGPSLQLLQHIRIIQLPEALDSGRVRVLYKGQELGRHCDSTNGHIGSREMPRGNGHLAGASLRITNKTIEKAFGPTWTPSGVKNGASNRPVEPRLIYRGLSFGLEPQNATDQKVDPPKGKRGTPPEAVNGHNRRSISDLAVYNAQTYEETGGADLALEEPLYFAKAETRDSRRNGIAGRAESKASALSVDAVKATDVMVGMLRRCEAVPGKQVVLHFFSATDSSPQSVASEDLESLTITLRRTTAQDLLLDLGPPLRKYWKEDNRLSEVWGGADERGRNGRGVTGDDRGGDGGGCWWNYFQHGMDFLIAEEGRFSGRVIKVLMHSNVPGSALFQRHASCPWTILAPAQSGQVTYTCAHKLEDIMAGMRGTSRDSNVKSMSLDRTIEGGLEGVTGIEPSRLAATDGLVLEEAHGGGITSVLIS